MWRVWQILAYIIHVTHTHATHHGNYRKISSTNGYKKHCKLQVRWRRTNLYKCVLMRGKIFKIINSIPFQGKFHVIYMAWFSFMWHLAQMKRDIFFQRSPQNHPKNIFFLNFFAYSYWSLGGSFRKFDFQVFGII